MTKEEIEEIKWKRKCIDISKLSEQFGSKCVADWGEGPLPSYKNRHIYLNVHEAAKDLTDCCTEKKELYFNALVDISLITIGELFGELESLTEEQIWSIVYVINNTIGCRYFTPSGVNWWSEDIIEWVENLKNSDDIFEGDNYENEIIST